MNFAERLMRTVEPQWTAMLAHPFLRQTADGTLPAGSFEIWLRQDYLFVREDLGFIGCLNRAPVTRHTAQPPATGGKMLTVSPSASGRSNSRVCSPFTSTICAISTGM